MSGAWPTVRLVDLAAPAKGAIAGGPFGSDLVSADYVEDGVPVIRGVNLPFDRKIALDNLVFVSEAKADSLHLNCAVPGDLVFTQRGTLGQVGLLPEHPRYSRYLISQSQMKMTIDPVKANALYLYYYFRLPSSVTYIENHALQSGVPHINLGILRNLEVILPPLPVQQQIAAVLESYDELIANNQRRIALLESMAEEIYREWFVRMRFPGFETNTSAKGIPSGWNVVRLGQHCRVFKGKSYTSDDLVDDPTSMPFVTLKSFNRGGGYRAGGLKYYKGEFKSDQVVKQGATVMAVTDMTQDRVVVGQAARVPDLGDRGAVISLDVIKLEPKDINPTYLYLLLRFSGFASHIKEFANGANVLHLKPDLVAEQKVLMAPHEMQERVARIAEPMLQQAEQLAESCQQLSEIRDALLPRLISGKLRVDGLDIQFPPSMLPPSKHAPQPMPGAS